MIYDNSVKYNGTGHECTAAARKLLDKADECLAAENDEITEMENGIMHSQNNQQEFLQALDLSGLFSNFLLSTDWLTNENDLENVV